MNTQTDRYCETHQAAKPISEDLLMIEVDEFHNQFFFGLSSVYSVCITRCCGATQMMMARTPIRAPDRNCGYSKKACELHLGALDNSY